MFQKSNYNAYRNSLHNGNSEDAILKGRSYYLSLSKKSREEPGITNIIQIDARVRAEVDAAKKTGF